MRKFFISILAVLLLPLAAAAQMLDASPQQSPVSDATLFTFRHVIVDTSADTPGICLRFSQNLDPSAAAHYGDYLQISPPLKPAVTATGTDLCLGGLDYATTYHLTIRAGLQAASGAKLATGQKLDVSLADRAPLVAIGGDGFILSRATTNGLTVQTVNVARVKIHVLRMSDKLLPSQLGPNFALTAQSMAPDDLQSLLQSSVSIAWTGTMDVPQDHNRTVSTAFALAGIVPPGRNGLYLVVAEDAAHAMPDGFFTGATTSSDQFSSNVATHWVVATDIALTSINGTDGLHVFARSLAAATPLANVDIRLIAAGQDTLGKLLTDANGQAVFPASLLAGARANAATTLLAYGPDGSFAFQDLTAPAFDLSDRGVSGRAAPADLQVFMYTDRGIYRPGETINVMALARDRLGNAVKTTPLKFLVRRPDGVVDHGFVAQPPPDGGFFQPVTLSATAARGMWTIEAYADPTAAASGRVQVDVEDFVPQQLKVTLATTQTYMAPSDAITAALDGQFLYGAPAAGLHAQGDLRVVRDTAPVPNAAGYSFGLVDDKVDDIDQSLTLDDADQKGDLQISAPLPDLPNTSLPLKAILTAGLFEPGGRYVSNVVTVPIRSQPLLIGIKPMFADGQVGDGQPATFDILTFDQAGAQAATPGLSWTLVQENQIFDWFQDSGSNWTFHYHTEDQQLASGNLDSAATAPALFTAPGLGQYDWGTYRLIVTDKASGAITSVRFSVGWDNSAAAASTPDKAEISAEKPLLAPGETTKIHIKGPFAGQAQIVIGNSRIFSTQTLDVPKDGATINVTADANWGAGAYVIVSLYRPLNAGNPHDPVRAMGVAWLGIDPASHKLNVAIDAPAKVTPRQTVNIPVKIANATAGDTPYVTLAAVDEGILQLTDYATPDPLNFLYGKVDLAMDIRDDYGNLLDGSADPGAIHSGGDAAALGGAGLPVTSTKVVALFSGPVTVAADGTASIPIQVPDFEGQLRLMAVAYNAGQVGAGQATLIVRDPVIEDVALPRFLAPGDTASLAVSLHNTDGPAGTYHLAISSTGAASVAVAHEYTLAAGQRLQTTAIITANDVGIADIAADLSGPNGYKVHRTWQIAVRAAHYPVTLQSVALQAKGQDFKPDPKLLASFAPGGLQMSIGYAAYRGIDVPSLLQSLWLYPYGCTEQLTSESFPLLYYNRKAMLAAAIPGDPDNDDGWQDASDAGVKTRVQQAIDTILDREDDTGAFGLWSVGDDEASAWLNVYVMDFLIRAKAAGYQVPDDALARGDANLLDLVSKIDSGAQGTSDTEQGLEAPSSTLAYAEYVLARVGQGDIGLLRRVHDSAVFENGATAAAAHYVYWQPGSNGAAPAMDTLAQPLALAQLGGALAQLGDKGRAESALQMAIANIGVTDYPVWWFDDAYYTRQRDLAGIIAIAADTGDDDLANRLLLKFAALKINVNDDNTQDTAWLLSAAHALDKDNAQVDFTLNGKALAPLSLPAAFAPVPAQITAGYDIMNGGTHDLWRTFTLTGAPIHALPPLSRGYTLVKSYFNIDGSKLNPAHLRQNDRFIVSLAGQVDDDDDHRTVLVDLLPAGWEIEAPITDDSTDYGFLGPLSKPNVVEARDDRFVTAFNLGAGWSSDTDDSDSSSNDQDDSKVQLQPGSFHVAYLVRVVTPGHFTLPEAEVNDMYRPALMARTAAGQTIADPR